MNASNIYQINVFQVFKFMYKAKSKLNPRVFDNTLQISIKDTQQDFQGFQGFQF